MLQIVDGLEVFVVDLQTMPELPITWERDEEQPYALALETALRAGAITVPGKYGIYVEGTEGPKPIFNLYHIIEE